MASRWAQKSFFFLIELLCHCVCPYYCTCLCHCLTVVVIVFESKWTSNCFFFLNKFKHLESTFVFRKKGKKPNCTRCNYLGPDTCLHLHISDKQSHYFTEKSMSHVVNAFVPSQQITHHLQNYFVIIYHTNDVPQSFNQTKILCVCLFWASIISTGDSCQGWRDHFSLAHPIPAYL